MTGFHDAEHVAAALGGHSKSGDGWVARCPAHEDRRASLKLTDREGKLLVHCHAGCEQDRVLDALKRLGLWGSTANTVVPFAAPTPAPTQPQQGLKLVATYNYVDEAGTVRYQKLRYHPKTFRQRRPAQAGDPPEAIKDGWIWNLAGIPALPYQLPSLIGAGQRAVFVVEGEKDVETLGKHGVIATCSHTGAGKFPAELAKYFKGATVILCPDNDSAGWEHAQRAWDVIKPVAKLVRCLILPGLAPKGDITDWFEAGGTREQLSDLVRAVLQGPELPPPQKTIERETKEVARDASERKHEMRLEAMAEQPVRPVAENPDGTKRPVSNVTTMRASNLAAHIAPEIATLPPEYSDEQCADGYVSSTAGTARYVSAWNKWFHWSGTVWDEDQTQSTVYAIRNHCKALAVEALTNPGIESGKQRQAAAMVLSSWRKMSAVEQMARNDRRVAATTDQWDTDPWLLNTPAGVIDLRTGQGRPARPEQYLTKQTTVAPNAASGCPTWERFLGEVCLGDRELVAYLQRVIGYCLSGSIQEHALFFMYGTGGNGKSTFIDTIQRILGKGYARSADMEMFTAKSNPSHPTSLAALRGSRLVIGQETEEGARWAESKIKALTGGSPITARFMRQDEFEFMPAFKLFITGNHKPTLRNVDPAMRRRLHMIPFLADIPRDQRDPLLPEKLLREGPGILAWAIEGCKLWLEKGLSPPSVVTKATDDYFENEDTFGGWLETCTARIPSQSSLSGDLYQSFREFCESAGEYVISQKRFSQLLESRGLPKKRHAKGWLFLGIEITAASSRPGPYGRQSPYAD